jgi:purine-binding chemotaxis protein CheW
VGILVDAVNEVMDIAGSNIEPAPDFGTRISTGFIAGMARIEDRFVIILDPARVLSVDEIAVLAQSGAPGAAAAAANDPADKEMSQAEAA